MGKFFGGLVVGILVVFLAGFFWIRMGLINPRADANVNTLEEKIAMPSLDLAVARRAPEVTNPVPATDANLIVGMKIYQMNCSNCHGDIGSPRGAFADTLYPRPPQFLTDAPDMPENHNFYIIQHGIRLSGMPAWGKSLNDRQIWEVTTFLSHIDKLPAPVTEQWKAALGMSDTSTH